MVTIVLAAGWAHRGQNRFEGTTGRLPTVIKTFAAQHPHYRRRLLDDDGEPYTYYTVYLDDQPVPRAHRSDVEVPPGSTVTIVPPLAGG